MTPEKPDPEPLSTENRQTPVEKPSQIRPTLTPQKSEDKKPSENIKNSTISRALSPGSASLLSNNTSVNSAGKIKSQQQAKVNTGSPKKKMRASPVILDTIVNDVVSKHTAEKQEKYEEDMNNINECVYLTKVCNDEEDKKGEAAGNDILSEKQDIAIFFINLYPEIEGMNTKKASNFLQKP